MRTFVNPCLRALCALLLLSGAAGCKVDFPNDVPYTCEADADCGGDSYKCTALPDNGPKYCCLPDPDELCNGVDDDCDGAVDEQEGSCYTGPEGTRDVGPCKSGQPACSRSGTVLCLNQVLPGTEVCNGQDEDCDGQADEDFNFQTDNKNCGRCGVVCTFLQNCVNGTCVRRTELNCGDGIDDEGDGPQDCLDREDCENQSCGTGCVCRGGRRVETVCSGGLDEDGDGPRDCADRDCDNQSCGAGCTCLSGVAKETICDDGIDNDGNGGTDCQDPDCLQETCAPGRVCKTSGARTGCVEGTCDDGIDNDGVGGADCTDPVCIGESCGMGCVCGASVPGGGPVASKMDPGTLPTRRETTCNDGLDNDGDSAVDCGDLQDCSRGTACSRLVDGQRVAGACNGTGACVAP
ncbi:hypothetical protein HPC49_11370 [Pyxidicoccus fallax]|uniref:Lipoprotein n=1 Tax=Pyxidicoccus fallax TaxID=394095 RepID=A0A848LEF4_9BACT|nr:MopE-related protein [Pyxidicoccus fallax]NMO17097.1 hypothetical protein [Pyxidicoccus fallax]NPC78838.1 hypothetical protein [Pyxidicoccus fallax]